MAVDNIFSALILVLRNNTNISSQLGFYPGSVIPIVQAGNLAETVTDLPAITIRTESMDDLNKKVGDESFIINCFAEDEIKSTKLARTIIKELDDTTITVDGYSMRFTAGGLSSNGDPTAREINTPVSMRVVYWR